MADYNTPFTGPQIDETLYGAQDSRHELIESRGAFDSVPERLGDVDRNIENVKDELSKLNPPTLTTQVVERQFIPGSDIEIGNHTETRYTLGGAATSAIVVSPIMASGNEFYAMIVLPVSFSETTTVNTFISGNMKFLNKYLDITDFEVVHITVYWDGFQFCCVVSGY